MTATETDIHRQSQNGVLTAAVGRPLGVSPYGIEWRDLNRARDYLQRGEVAEALIWLERGLGRDFDRLADKVAAYFGAARQ